MYPGCIKMNFMDKLNVKAGILIRNAIFHIMAMTSRVIRIFS